MKFYHSVNGLKLPFKKFLEEDIASKDISREKMKRSYFDQFHRLEDSVKDSGGISKFIVQFYTYCVPFFFSFKKWNWNSVIRVCDLPWENDWGNRRKCCTGDEIFKFDEFIEAKRKKLYHKY